MAKRRSELGASTVVPSPGVKVHGPPVPIRPRTKRDGRARAPAVELARPPAPASPTLKPEIVDVLRSVAVPDDVIADLEAWAGVARTGLEALELLRRRRK